MAEKYKVVTPNGPVQRIIPGVGMFLISNDLPDSIIEKFIAIGTTEYFEEIPAEAEPEKKNE